MTVWEYRHQYAQTATVSEERAFGLGAAKEVATQYDLKGLQDTLNRMAGDGWELVSMEPNWYYEQKNISGAAAIARPLAIIGWYLTFKRGAP